MNVGCALHWQLDYDCRVGVCVAFDKNIHLVSLHGKIMSLSHLNTVMACQS